MIGYLNKIKCAFKKISSNADINPIIANFFNEIEKHRSSFKNVLVNVLGKEKAEKVVEFDKRLLSPNSYLFKSSDLKNYITHGFQTTENLLFCVAIDPEDLDGTFFDSNGQIEGNIKIIKSSPFFIFRPEIIRKRAQEIKETPLPPFFTLWLHEYCHFIGFCLQKRPIALAIAILYYFLSKKNNADELKTVDLGRFLDNNKKLNSEIARTAIFIQGLDEDMANYLRELILKEMGFDMKDYSKLVKGTFFYSYFNEWGKEKFIDFMEDWHNANFKAPQFMKTFLKSLNGIKFERCPKK